MRLDSALYTMTLDEAIQLIPDGECLLFAGAGFSALGKNKYGENLPTGSDLATILDKESGFESDGNLMDASEYFREYVGDSSLIDLLNEYLTPMDISDSQCDIVERNWRRIYTTNYDDSIEFASRKRHIRRNTVDRYHKPSDFKDKRNIIIHLNGSLSNLTATSLDSDFKLTNGSYLAEELNDNPWREIFRNDLRDCKAVFFVGFSMSGDLELAKIAFNSENLREKCFFIVRPDESKHSQFSLHKFGNVECIGADEFARKIAALPKNNKIPTTTEPAGHCFVRSGNVPPADKITDKDRRDLFIWGKFSEAIMNRALTLSDHGKYFIYRNRLDEILNSIQKGLKNVVVHSEIGNGKTLFATALAAKLNQNDYFVYILRDDNDDAFSELEKITSVPSRRVAVVVEQYHVHRRLIEKLRLLSSEAVLIATERTVYNDMNIDWFTEQANGDFQEINLNRLIDDEINQISDIFETNGFWADLSAEHTDKKITYLTTDCARSLRIILLGLLNTKSIRDSIINVINTLNGRSSYRDCLILILINAYLSLNMDMDMISFGLNKNLDSDKLGRDTVIKEFVDVRDGTISVRSSLLAEVLLGKIIDISVVKDILVKVFHQFDNARHEKRYSDILANLLTFRTLRQPLKGNKEKFHSVISSFYEEIRECMFCHQNPHFWLQYAIAVMDDGDYRSAEIYFDNAYSYCRRRRDYDSFQIDNHYARYLLENGAINEFDKDYMKVFRKANAIITDRSHWKVQKYYPFKVARHYLEFVERYSSKFSDDERNEIKKDCTHILKMIEEFRSNNPNYANRRDVRECEKNMNRIIDSYC